jgi:hypothetical protein
MVSDGDCIEPVSTIDHVPSIISGNVVLPEFSIPAHDSVIDPDHCITPVESNMIQVEDIISPETTRPPV